MADIRNKVRSGGLITPAAGVLKPRPIGRSVPHYSALLTSANSESLSILDAGQTGLDILDSDFSINMWVKPSGLTSTVAMISKGNVAATVHGYKIWRAGATMHYFVSDGSSHLIDITGGSIADGVWSMLTFVISRAGQAQAFRNNVGEDVADMTTNPGTINSASAFKLGDESSRFWNGNIDMVGIWARVLTAGEMTTLYNNGLGRNYSQMADFKTSLVSFWDLDEVSDGTGAVTRLDSFGTNHLTDNNTVPSGNPVPS